MKDLGCPFLGCCWEVDQIGLYCSGLGMYGHVRYVCAYRMMFTGEIMGLGDTFLSRMLCWSRVTSKRLLAYHFLFMSEHI